MFKISGTKILITRGDKGVIKFEIENYKFKKDDIIDFKIYKAKQLTQSPIKSKIIIKSTKYKNERKWKKKYQKQKTKKLLN